MIIPETQLINRITSVVVWGAVYQLSLYDDMMLKLIVFPIFFSETHHANEVRYTTGSYIVM